MGEARREREWLEGGSEREHLEGTGPDCSPVTVYVCPHCGTPRDDNDKFGHFCPANDGQQLGVTEWWPVQYVPVSRLASARAEERVYIIRALREKGRHYPETSPWVGAADFISGLESEHG